MRRWIQADGRAADRRLCCHRQSRPSPRASVVDAPPLIAGRLSAADGDVRIWRTEEDGRGAWDRAELNDVVTVGVGIATDNGRAEVRVGPHAFRLGVGSSGGFSQLDFAGKVFNLERGSPQCPPRASPAGRGRIGRGRRRSGRPGRAGPLSHRRDRWLTAHRHACSRARAPCVRHQQRGRGRWPGTVTDAIEHQLWQPRCRPNWTRGRSNGTSAISSCSPRATCRRT